MTISAEELLIPFKGDIMLRRLSPTVLSTILVFTLHVGPLAAQKAGQSIKVSFGTVVDMQRTTLQSEAARGAIVGGVIGYHATSSKKSKSTKKSKSAKSKKPAPKAAKKKVKKTATKKVKKSATKKTTKKAAGKKAKKKPAKRKR